MLSLPLVPVVALFGGKFRRGHLGRAGAAHRLQAWARPSGIPPAPWCGFTPRRSARGCRPRASSPASVPAIPTGRWPTPISAPRPRSSPGAWGPTSPTTSPTTPPPPPSACWRHSTDRHRVHQARSLAGDRDARGAPGHTDGLVAGTVRPSSSRLRWPTRQLLASGYRAWPGRGAIAEDDAARLLRLGARPETVSVLGDPRFDSVLDVVDTVPPDDPLLGFGAGAVTMVAGSTWPGDEAVLLEAFARLRVRHPDARLILAPHEPTPGTVDRGGSDGGPGGSAAAGALQHAPTAPGPSCWWTGWASWPASTERDRWPTWGRVPRPRPAFGAGAGRLGDSIGFRPALGREPRRLAHAGGRWGRGPGRDRSRRKRRRAWRAPGGTGWSTRCAGRPRGGRRGTSSPRDWGPPIVRRIWWRNWWRGGRPSATVSGPGDRNPLDRNRPGHDQPERQAGDQQIEEPAADADLHIGMAGRPPPGRR